MTDVDVKDRKEKAFSLRLPPDLYNQVVREAVREDRSTASMVRKMIEFYFSRKGKREGQTRD